MKPFEGVKVVDLSTVIAASSAARILADQGAEVIKVEALSGDLHRVQGAILGVPIQKDENPVFDVENANKRFVSLDLKSSAGKQILLDLVKDADVLIPNYREDALTRLGPIHLEAAATHCIENLTRELLDEERGELRRLLAKMTLPLTGAA